MMSKKITKITKTIPNVLGNWEIGELVGSGNFGAVFKTTPMQNSKYFEEIKSEMINKNITELVIKVSRAIKKDPSLFCDYEALDLLSMNERCSDFIPKIIPRIYGGYSDGFENGSWHYLVMENIKGKNLKEMLSIITPEIAYKLGILILDGLQQMHTSESYGGFKGWLYRDVKPENFIWDTNKKTVVVVDFGIVSRYPDEKEYLQKSGTPLFYSLNVHDDGMPSPIDDLESLFYLIVYLAKNGEIPWSNEINEQVVHEMKKKLHHEKDLSNNEIFKSLSPYMINIFDIIRNTKINEEVDYDSLRNLLLKASITGSANDIESIDEFYKNKKNIFN